jgi:hypothetical protein
MGFGRWMRVLVGAVGLLAASLLGATSALAQCTGNTCVVTVASDPGTSSSGTTGAAGTLSYALAYANAQSSPVTINIETNVTLSGALSPILTTASAEWTSGWSAAATFEGEFSNVTRSYAGKGLVRYQW